MGEYKNFAKEVYMQLFSDLSVHLAQFAKDETPAPSSKDIVEIIEKQCSALDSFKFCVINAILNSQRYFIANIDSPVVCLGTESAPTIIDLPHPITAIEGYSGTCDEVFVLAWGDNTSLLDTRTFLNEEHKDDILFTTFHKVYDNSGSRWTMSYGTKSISRNYDVETGCVALFPWSKEEFKYTPEYKRGDTIQELISQNNELGFVAIHALFDLLLRKDVVIYEENRPSKLRNPFKKQSLSKFPPIRILTTMKKPTNA